MRLGRILTELARRNAESLPELTGEISRVLKPAVEGDVWNAFIGILAEHCLCLGKPFAQKIVGQGIPRHPLELVLETPAGDVAHLDQLVKGICS